MRIKFLIVFVFIDDELKVPENDRKVHRHERDEIMFSKFRLPCLQQAIRLNAGSMRNCIFSRSDRNFQFSARFQSNGQKSFTETAHAERALRGRSIAYYSISAVVVCVGLTYAAVPLYRLFCQVSEEKHELSSIESHDSDPIVSLAVDWVRRQH